MRFGHMSQNFDLGRWVCRPMVQGLGKCTWDPKMITIEPLPEVEILPVPPDVEILPITPDTDAGAPMAAIIRSMMMR